MNMQQKIIDIMEEVAASLGAQLVRDLGDETILLQSGLDSLGFAILVARLEEDLGYDPFVISDEPYYPRTLKDFVSFYERLRPTI